MTKADDAIFVKAKNRFKEAQEAESDMREKAVRDIDFADGEQWEDSDKQDRDGRPTLVINKIAGALKMIRGNQRRSVPAVRVIPVDGTADPEIAHILNGLIRNIEYNSNAETAYDTAFDHSIDGGWGYYRIDAEYAGDDTFEQDLVINRITNQFSVHLDPSYKKADASDIGWAFIDEFMSEEKYKEKYGEKKVTDWISSRGQEFDSWFTQAGVRIAEYWYKEPTTMMLYELANGDTLNQALLDKEGAEYNPESSLITWGNMPESALQVKRTRKIKTHKIMWCKLSGDGILEGPVERPGKYIPIIIIMGEEKYVNGKRKFKSAHHDSRDSQKVYNWMVSTSVETVSMSPKQPWIVADEQVEGHEEQWNIAHHRPMPYLKYNHVPGLPPPQRQMGAIPNSGANVERMGASDDIKATTGFFDASLGNQANETSGVAIARRQLQSDTSSFVFTDNLKRGLTFGGKVLIDLIPYYYDSERIIRILGKDGSEMFVPINKTVVDKTTGEKQTINDITQGKYDVVVEIGASFNTQRQEAEAKMIELTTRVPGVAPHILDLVVKNMDFPGAEEIYERIKALMEKQQEGPPPDPEKELDMEKKKVDIQKVKIDNTKNMNELFNELAISSGDPQVDIIADKAIQSGIANASAPPGQPPAN